MSESRMQSAGSAPTLGEGGRPGVSDESSGTGSASGNGHAVAAEKPKGSWRQWVISVVLVLLLAAGAAVYWFTSGERGASSQPAGGQASAAGEHGGAGRGRGGGGAIPVLVGRVTRGDFPVYLTGLGTVTPYNVVTVRPRVDGQVMEVAFAEGQEVKEGDLLVQIDPRPFEIQLQQAQGQLQRDQAQLENARSDLEKYRSAGASVSRQEIDTAVAQVRQLEASLVIDNAAIGNAKLQLEYAAVKAPISGRIGLRLVDEGNLVRAGDTQGMAVITQIKPITVVFTIPQTELPGLLDALRTAQDAGSSGAGEAEGAGLPVEAFDRDFTRLLAKGRLLALDNQIDPATGTIKLKARFENEDGRLFPNEFVNVRLLVRTLEDVVLTPTVAVQRGPDGSFVYVVEESDDAAAGPGGGKAMKVAVVPVQLGPTAGDVTVVQSGLSPGQRVVTDGVDKLTQGSPVTAREEAASAGPTTGPTTRSGHGHHSGSSTRPANHASEGGTR